MGRRKIEIKAIKDDRSRSVTFLKRKGGLFKKAHELSVLCSVDVAVIIFGQNKKLYEFSSGNIQETLARYQYYGGAHEHKGPADFAGKVGGDEDDDDEENLGSPQPGDVSPPHHGVIPPQQFANHATVQHIRHPAPSASPPMPNGVFQHRMSSPQIQNLSRPSSVNHARRQSSNLVPQDHPHPQASQPNGMPMGYPYQPNANVYHNQPAATANMRTPPLRQVTYTPQRHSTQPIPQQRFAPLPPSSQGPVQQAYMQEQRRQSMPPNFPQQAHQERLRNAAPMPSQSRPARPFQSPPLPEPRPLQTQGRSHSIFTPVDENRSVLAQHLGSEVGPQSNESTNRVEPSLRSQSFDVGATQNQNISSGCNPVTADKYTAPVKLSQRAASTSAIGGFDSPLRLNSTSSDTKRPRLTVQIPGEPEDAGSATSESAARESGTPSAATPSKHSTTENSHSGSGVVLPPPSPSKSAILSAGASGPANPFARPGPPNSSMSSNTTYKDLETPMSALPSRFMSDGLLPSPSSMLYMGQDWWGHMGNNLASPAIYQPTPVAPIGPSFKEDDADKKRKSTDDSVDASSKRQKA